MPLTAARVYGITAAVATIGLLGGSVVYWAVALTFGVISGLLVLMAPAYPLFVQAAVVTIVANVCLWLRSPLAALLLGLPIVTLPQVVMVAWYGKEWLSCLNGPVPAACLDYLNGSPLLPVVMGGALVAGGLEVVILFGYVAFARRTLV